MSAPSDGVRAPSATVFGLSTVCSCPRPERSRRIVSRRGLDADHLAARRQRRRGDRRAGQQSAAAAGHEEIVERADFFDQLARGRALAGDDVRVIVGRDQRQAALVREPAADRLAVLAVAIVEDDLAAVAFRGDALHGRRVGRHDDDARDVEHLPGERDRLRVVAGREGDDAAAALVGRRAATARCRRRGT